MVKLIATAVTFAVGLLFLPILIPGVRVRGTADALKAGIVGGILSAALGRVLLVLLSLVFFPIRLLGPLAAVLVQAVVNFGLLLGTSHFVPGVQFKRWSDRIWAAVALTVLQVVVGFID